MISTFCFYICTTPFRMFCYILSCCCIFSMLSSTILITLFLIALPIIVILSTAICFTIIEYIYPSFSFFEKICKPAADCIKNNINKLQFQIYPETIRDLCRM
jgi:hypothetical protein